MKEVPLTRGRVALVDDEDYERLLEHKWTFDGKYAFTSDKAYYKDTGKRRNIYMHRFINQTPEGMATDHINGNRLDNRKGNLRTATYSQNGANKRKFGKSSNYKCVYYWKKRDCYVAFITYKGKQKNLGCFKTEKEAALAYNKKALECFGEFAKLNEIT